MKKRRKVEKCKKKKNEKILWNERAVNGIWNMVWYYDDSLSSLRIQRLYHNSNYEIDKDSSDEKSKKSRKKGKEKQKIMLNVIHFESSNKMCIIIS